MPPVGLSCSGFYGTIFFVGLSHCSIPVDLSANVALHLGLSLEESGSVVFLSLVVALCVFLFSLLSFHLVLYITNIL